jgi:hypothetical protein
MGAVGLKTAEKGRSAATAAALHKARLHLEEAGRLLLQPTPAVLANCETLLASAVAELESTRQSWHYASGDVLAGNEARALRKALKLAHRLLENAANFYGRWRGITAPAGIVYQADGHPQPVRQPARILVSG